VDVRSVTKGKDKPPPYPHMYRRADLVLLNDVDLRGLRSLGLGTATGVRMTGEPLRD